MSSRVQGLSPADASMRLVEWLMYYQSKMEEQLGQDLGVKNVKDEIMGGFLDNRKLTPRDRQRIDLLIKVMSLGQRALEVPIGKGSNSAGVLEPMVDEAEAIFKEFEKL
jgi:hypothetical protein